MARIYEFPENLKTPDLEGSTLKSFDPVTKRAVIRFWISVAGIVFMALMLYYFTRGILSPPVAIVGVFVCLVIALILLVLMNRSLGSMHLISKDAAKLDQRIDAYLNQLDDRFAVFNSITAGDYVIDHIIVGPSGAYVVKPSATLDSQGWPRAGDMEQLLEETKVMRQLTLTLLPDSTLRFEPVLCVPAGSVVKVDQEDGSGWVVAAEKLATALIKRSSQQGSIGHNVQETGAFSSDALQSVALERALAEHWQIPTRRNRDDYVPPENLTSEP